MISRLSVDAGQSGIRCRTADGVVTQWPGVDAAVPLVPQLAETVRRAAPDGVETVLVGSTGLGPHHRAADLLDALPGTRHVWLAHDSVTGYLGSLGDRTGCVVAAGTGVVTLAVGRTHMHRVDGWGWILGDAGSGFWIGRRAIDAALRAYDRRAEPTALTELVARDFPDLETAYLELQADPGRVARIAAYAREVDALADRDATARRILVEAADELVTSVVSALEQVDGEPDDPVCAVGNVFGSATLRAELAAVLAQRRPAARIEATTGTGLDGAGLLDQATTGITERVDHATR